MNRIQKISKFFRVLFQIILVILPLEFVVLWTFSAPSLEPIYMLNGLIRYRFVPEAYTTAVEHGTHILHHLSVAEKLLSALLSFIPLAVTLFIFYSLVKLFKLYEKGEIFSAENVSYIRNIGYALLIGQIIDPFYQAAIGFVLTVGNPPGNGFMAVTLDQTNVETVLIALMVILISWIMAEGCQLREDQQLTI